MGLKQSADQSKDDECNGINLSHPITIKECVKMSEKAKSLDLISHSRATTASSFGDSDPSHNHPSLLDESDEVEELSDDLKKMEIKEPNLQSINTDVLCYLFENYIEDVDAQTLSLVSKKLFNHVIHAVLSLLL